MTWILCGLLAGVLVVFDVSASVKVSVYYEALCPDSVRFIAKQLYPNYKQIAEYIDLDLVPYGKAIHNERDGYFDFSCQHGPMECKGNMYQACMLSMNYGTEKNVNFVNCVMRKRNPSHLSSIETCAKKYNLDIEKIKDCALSTKGGKLLALNGDKTWKLEPTISYVPTIVYDDEFNQTEQDQSLSDFVAVVCSKINGSKPSVCDNRPLPKANSWGFYY